ncbi:MAG: T9SS type A sorting domain-containing protein, partial [Bacteroidetes bacterium]|nr:T9SS type A sorting domain-containing protein [Bacteroidota bacterium]
IYTQAEITAYGTITTLAWYVGTSQSTSIPVKIYLKTTSSSTLSATTWATMTSGATLVYDASRAFNTTGWVTIDVSDFGYTADNLLVLCEANYGGSGTSSYPVFRYSAATSRHEYYQADGSPPSGNGTVNASRPQIQITIASCSNPTISSVTPTNPSCNPDGSIQINTTGTITDYSIDNGSSWTASSNNTYTFNSLTADIYNVKVRNTASCVTTYGSNPVTLTAPSTSATPVVTSPICDGSTSVSGTCAEANGTSIEVFKGGVSQGTTTVTSSAWTKTGLTLADGNSITAKSAASGKCVSVASTPVVVTSAPNITGQPGNQGVAAGAGVATFTVTATGGVSYQWQEYISSWNNVTDGGVYSGATTASLVITNPDLSMDGYKYRCIVSGCSPSATSDGNATLTVTLVYCSPAPSSVDGSGITNITFGSINNTTGTETNNYGDYSGQSNTVVQGESVTVYITYSTGYTYGTKIWIDFNDDGDFLDAGELVYSGLSASANPTTLNAGFVVPGGAALGAHRMRIGGTDTDTGPVNNASSTGYCYTSTYASFEDYTIDVTAASPMVFNSCTATQTVTTPVAPFTVAQQIIGVQVVTTGLSSPLEVTSFTFNTTGCTAPTTDIICATLYFTGNSSTFSTAMSFGSVYSQPNGEFVFDGSENLLNGINYFWLTYDIPLAATIDNYLDAECTNVTVDGSDHEPDVTDPGSGRLIAYTFLHEDNNPVSACSGAYYDEGGISGQYSTSTSYVKTFIPDAGKVMRLDFTSFSTEANYDSLTIYNGPSTSSPFIGKWHGASSPGTVTATSATGELTVSFKSDAFTNADGWAATISCQYLPPNCATYTSPADGATNQPTNTPIVWTAPSADGTHNPATSYKLYFGTDAAATNMYNGTNIGNVTSWGAMLSTSTTYYWKIVPVNACGEAAGCSEIRSFTTSATPTLTTITVCASGCDFTTIKSAYNSCSSATPFVINVKSGYAGEAYPIVFDNTNSVPTFRSSANPITIRPDAGFSYTFTSAANKTIEIKGAAKYIYIDGRQGGTGTANSFVFQNTSTTTPVVNITESPSYISLAYCKIQGKNQSTGIVNLVSPNGTGIHHITLDNNEICPNGAAFPTDGILSEGTGALKNTEITISNNKIYDIWADVAFASHGIYFGSNGYNNSCTLSGNSVYFTSSKTPTASNTNWYGIYVKGDNHIVSNNYVGGTQASCGGTALTVLGTKENHIYGVVVRGTSAASTTVVSGNTIQKISLSTTHRSSDQLTGRTASTTNQSFAALVIDAGSATVSSNIIGSTTSGDITVINTNTTNPGTVNGAGTYGYSTELAGIVYNTKTGSIHNSGNSIKGLWCYPSSTATTNLNARVIGILASTDNAVSEGYTHTITYNTISDLKAGNNTTSDAFAYGILTSTGRGSIYINHNDVSNLFVNASGDYGLLRGIHNNAGTRAELEYNTVSNLVCAAQNDISGGYARNRSIVGIMCDNDGGFLDHFFVNKNEVYDLRSTATTAQVNLIGIYYRHADAPVYGRVFGNKVYSINAASSDKTSILVGVWAYGQNTITYNNMITLGSNVSAADGASCPASPVTTGGYELIGLENNYGMNEYYYNSVNIVGETGVGASNSYAYKFTNGVPDAQCRKFINNIFSNTRSSTAGAAKHYAFSVNVNETCFSSNYNYFYVSGTGGVLFDDCGTDRTTIAAWNTATGKDANSSGGTASGDDPLFVAPNTCDCDLNITDGNSPIVAAGTTSGVPAYILDDFFGTSRAGTHDIGAVTTSALLPIELLNFTAFATSEKIVQLWWITVSETNNDYFTIERSSDGISFQPIAYIRGAGNSNSREDYEAFDNSPLNGTGYYRLKQTDFNGKYTYSRIVEVTLEDGDFSVEVFPNPFSSSLFVDIKGSENISTEVQITNLSGVIVFSDTIHDSSTRLEIQGTENFPAGIYLVHVQNEFMSRAFKVVKF